MHEILREAFRHGAWATGQVLQACRALQPAELKRPGRGYGSLLAILTHLVNCDAHYLALLGAERPDWAIPEPGEQDLASLDLLEERVSQSLARWEELLAAGPDPDATMLLDRGAYRCHHSVVVVQALHHATAHREQVRAALQEYLGEAPDLQPWSGAQALGRAEHLERDVDDPEDTRGKQGESG